MSEKPHVFCESLPVPLDFVFFRNQNVNRCREVFGKEVNDWSSAQWCCALAGEVGELCNIVKKEFRGFDRDRDAIQEQNIKDEIADIFTYLDLFAASRGFDLAECVRDKFNRVSEKMNSKRFV